MQIAVSRESVDKMPENEEKILDKIKKVNEEVLRKVKKDVESCKTLQDHYKVRREFFNYYNNRETTHMDPKTGITLKKDLLDGLFTKKYEIQDFPFTIDETGKAKNDHYLAFFEFKRYYTKRYGKKVFNQLVVDTREVDYTEQNEDGVAETKQRTEVLEKELDLTKSTLYLFLDQEEKPRNLSRKIKQLLLTGIQNPDGVVVKPREVVLVQPKMDHEFSFKDEIFWKNSSTVILPKPVKREKDDRIVVFSVGSKAYGGYKLVSEKYDQEELSDYHDDGKKFVYFPVKGKGIGIDDVDFYHIKGLERYYSKRDCKLIGLSSASVKKWPEDVPLKELDLEELKEKGLKEEEKAAKILDNSMVDFIDSFVVHYFKDEDIARIKDKRMKFAISCKKTMNKVAQESDLGSALELFTEESKKIDDRKNKYKEFFLKLKKDYKCLRHINYNYSRGISYHEKEERDEAKKELVEVVINLINSNWSGK